VLLGCPIVPLVDASNPAAAPADVVQHASVTSRRRPRSCKPVATVRRKSCTDHAASGAAVVPDAAAAFARASVMALSRPGEGRGQDARQCEPAGPTTIRHCLLRPVSGSKLRRRSRVWSAQGHDMRNTVLGPLARYGPDRQVG
jgi:hypothetical protein